MLTPTRLLTLGVGLALAAHAQAHLAEPAERFDGHRVIKVDVGTLRELNTVLALTDDLWNCGGVGLGQFDIRVSPEQYAQLVVQGIKHTVMINNVQELIDAENARLANRLPWGGVGDAGFFDDFRTYEEIQAYFQGLATTYPTLATYVNLGNSLEGRPIFGLRISGPGNSPSRPAYFVQGTQHAREWGNTTATCYHAEMLLTQYASNPTIQALVNNVEFIIVPIVNPDGYAYTWGPNRLWRKTRKPVGNGCFGVDTNRNWDWQWTGPGNSTDPCNDTYRGPTPFSEVETQTIRDFVLANPKIRASMDVHSFSQLFMWPWGWTDALSPDHATFTQIGTNAANTIKSYYGKTYDIGPIYTAIYPASGNNVDWMYGATGALAFTVEVRDQGGYGFIMPVSELLPNAIENFWGSMEIAKYIAQPLSYSLPNGVPAQVPPGATSPIQVSINAGTAGIQAGSEKLWARVGSGSFQASNLTSLGNGLYSGTLPAAPCNAQVDFFFTANTSAGQPTSFPIGGAGAAFSVNAIQFTAGFTDTAETNTGWVVGAPGDTAISGIWNRMDPQPTAAQPGDDHTPAPGVNCWVTDGNAGSQVGSFDVDGGATTLTSPTIDASALVGDVYVSYWRWYSNNQGGAPNADTMPISISSNNGTTWTQLELVGDNAGTWVNKQFKLSDLGISSTSQMKLRFVARDEGVGSIIEAAVDDVQFFSVGCPNACYADCDTNGSLTIDDFICFQTLYAIGDPFADCDSSGNLNIDDFICFQTNFALGC